MNLFSELLNFNWLLTTWKQTKRNENTRSDVLWHFALKSRTCLLGVCLHTHHIQTVVKFYWRIETQTKMRLESFKSECCPLVFGDRIKRRRQKQNLLSDNRKCEELNLTGNWKTPWRLITCVTSGENVPVGSEPAQTGAAGDQFDSDWEETAGSAAEELPRKTDSLLKFVGKQTHLE